ncbi:T9SS type A sorting domain-containing protein [bacterium]|nr:T9SS type A sorting domain-containing protein [bacterium]
MKKKLQVSFMFTGMALLIFMTLNSYAQTNWTKHPDNPIMTGAAGTWYEDVSNPSILIEQDTFKMWFRGYPDANAMFQIGYAWSTDGINWNIHPHPVIPVGWPGAWDRYRSIGTILRANDTLKMWYIATPNFSNYSIGYAWSLNGIAWNLHSGPVLEKGPPGYWDENNVYGGSVYYDGTVYRMWYDGVGADYVGRIGFATSQDGINWVKDYYNSPMLEPDSGTFYQSRILGGPLVKLGDTIYNFISGYDSSYYQDYHARIGYAYTTDYVNWTVGNNGQHVLDVGAPGEWDSFYAFLPEVLFHDGSFYMWYDGRNDTLYSRIGYALGDTIPQVGLSENNEAFSGNVSVFPNPFSNNVTITYQLAWRSSVKLEIIDVNGHLVSTLVDEVRPKGQYQAVFDAADLPNGIYFCVLRTNAGIESIKVVKH